MKNRKISGILKYAPKASSTIASFQAGGRLAIGKGYDYREDPYELALMRDENAQQIANTRAEALKEAANTRARATAAAAKDKTGKLEGFAPITDGLPAENKMYNELLQKDVDAYNKFIETNPITSLPAQQLFNAIKNRGIQYNALAKQNKDDFDAAYGKLDVSDLNTKAISVNGAVAMQDSKSGEVSIVSLDDYLEKGLDRKLLTNSEFADWKKNKDAKYGSTLSEEFLARGSFGNTKIESLYIAPKNDAIMAMSKDNVLSTVDESGKTLQITPDNFLATLSGANIGTTPKAAASNKKAVNTILESLYGDVLRGASSPLRSSLEAEVLSDPAAVKELKEKVPASERRQVLHNKAMVLLASKLLRPLTGGGDGKGKGSGGSGEGGSDEGATNGLKVPEYSGPLFAIADGTTRSKLRLNVSPTQILELPAVEGALTTSLLNISLYVDDKNPATIKNYFAKSNDVFNTVAMGEKGYTLNGKLSTTLSNIGENKAVPAGHLLATSPMLPTEDSDLVLIPVDNNQNIAYNLLSKFTPSRQTVRLAFLESVKKHGLGKDKFGNPITVSITRQDVSPNGFNWNKNPAKQAQSALLEKEYQNWLQLGVEYATTKESSAGEDPDNKRKLAMAIDANKALQEASKQMVKDTNGRGLYMKAMYKTKLIVKSEDFPGLYEHLKSQKIYNTDKDALREASDEEIEYAKKLGKDTSMRTSAVNAISRTFGGDPVPQFFVMAALFPTKNFLQQAISSGKLSVNDVPSMYKIDAITNNSYLEANAQTDLGKIKNIANLLKK